MARFIFSFASRTAYVVLRRPLRTFLLFWLITLALYAVAWRGGFERDFYGWLHSYHRNSFADCINGSFLGIRSLYQVTHLQLYLWTWLFGTHPIPWLLIMTGLHAAAHTLAFRFLHNLLAHLGVRRGPWIALAGAGIALAAPGAAEVAAFKAAYHYPVALISLFGILVLVQRSLVENRRQPLMAALLIFLPTLFTLEIWYATPVLSALLILAYRAGGVCTAQASRRALVGLVVPMILLFAAHLVLFQATAGKWVPHTQVTLEMALAAPFETLGKIGAVIFHVIFFGRYWSNGARAAVYDFTALPVVACIIAALLVGAFLICIIRVRTAGPAGRAAAWLLGALGVSLVMIIHFPLERLFIIYSDRWLYLTSIFQYTLLALLLARMLRYRRIAFAALAGYALVAAVLTLYTAVQWRRAARVFWGMQESYRWTDERRPVILLNAPFTLDGAVIFFTNEDGEDFREHLRIFQKKETAAPVYIASSHNLSKWWDGAHATVLDSARLKVTLSQWGTWWWSGGLGAVDYETPLYRVHFTDPGHEYELTWKVPTDSVVALYLQGARWHQVDFSRIGEEQRSEEQ